MSGLVVVMGRALVAQADMRLAGERLAQLPQSRDLPIPGSPESSTTWPSPSFAPAATGAAAARSPPRARPAASGRSPGAPRSALGPASTSTRQATSGSAKPLRRCGPRSSSSNRPPTSRRVAALITTRPARRAPAAAPPGSASRRPPRPCGTLADQVPHHHVPGRDADPRGSLAPRLRQARADDILDQLKPGPHRPLGIVLVRPRPAEIGQHAVAQVLGDVPSRTADHVRAGRLVGAASPRACPRDRAAPTARSSRPGRRTAPSAAAARLPQASH